MLLVKPLLARNGKRRGHAERSVRAYFRKHGCMVWRGNFLSSDWTAESVFFQYHYLRYEDLCRRMTNICGIKAFRRLRAYCKSHHGEPDFVVWDGCTLFFAEAKLENEALSRRQLNSIAFISRFFPVRVYRVFTATRQCEHEIDVAAALKDPKGLRAHMKYIERMPMINKKWERTPRKKRVLTHTSGHQPA